MINGSTRKKNAMHTLRSKDTEIAWIHDPIAHLLSGSIMERKICQGFFACPELCISSTCHCDRGATLTR